MIKCLVCNQELSSAMSYGGHLKRKHQMTAKDYYDKYLKKESEGICPICGKSTRFVSITKGYKKFCSLKCATPHIQEKVKQTCLERYGTENFGQGTKARQKAKETMNDKYGVDYFCTTEKCITAGHTDKAKQKAKETCMKKYGVSCGFKTEQCKKASTSTEATEKRKTTNMQRYGTQYTFANSYTDAANTKRNQTMIDKYGVNHNFKRPDVIAHNCSAEVMKKKHDTKKSNGWCRSKSEEYLDAKIIHQHKRNTKTPYYPWKVDFYVFDLDLYIEINAYWMHGGHWFDENNSEDQATLQKWINRNTEQDRYAIKIWTKSDLEKRDFAIKNNLNYVVLWNMNQIEQFIQDYNDGKQFVGFNDYNKLFTDR